MLSRQILLDNTHRIGHKICRLCSPDFSPCVGAFARGGEHNTHVKSCQSDKDERRWGDELRRSGRRDRG